MEQTYKEENRQKSLDVLVIGGGIVGTAVARELSRYTLTIGLVAVSYTHLLPVISLHRMRPIGSRSKLSQRVIHPRIVSLMLRIRS